MKKLATAVAGLIGLLASAIALYQVFSFNQLPMMDCSFHPGANSNLLDCVQDLSNRSGDTVMLEWSMYASPPPDRESDQPLEPNGVPYIREETDTAVDYYFDSCVMVESLGLQGCEGQAMFDAFNSGRVITESAPWDANGSTVRIVGSGQTTNPYSTFSIGSEMMDSASGPFQISVTIGDGSSVILLSPAPMTSALPAQVRCANRDWHPVAKFLGCPFN